MAAFRANPDRNSAIWLPYGLQGHSVGSLGISSSTASSEIRPFFFCLRRAPSRPQPKKKYSDAAVAAAKARSCAGEERDRTASAIQGAVPDLVSICTRAPAKAHSIWCRHICSGRLPHAVGRSAAPTICCATPRRVGAPCASARTSDGRRSAQVCPAGFKPRSQPWRHWLQRRGSFAVPRHPPTTLSFGSIEPRTCS